MAWSRHLCMTCFGLLLSSHIDGKYYFEEKNMRYATTNIGTEFYVAVPHNNEIVKPIAYLTFSTFEQLVKVNITMPINLYCMEFGYAESMLTLVRRAPFTHAVSEMYRIRQAGRGYSIIIRATGPISVLFMVASSTPNMDIIMLPPADLMGWEYYIYADILPSWMLFLNAFDDNEIKFHLARTTPVYEVYCGLSTLCRSGKQYDVTLQQGQFFYFYTTAPNDTISQASLTGTRVEATKPVLVLCGNIVTVKVEEEKIKRFSMYVARSYASWGTSYTIMTSQSKRQSLSIRVVTNDPSNSGVVYDGTSEIKFQFDQDVYIQEIAIDKALDIKYYYCTTQKPALVVIVSKEVAAQGGLLFPLVPDELFTNLVVFTDAEWTDVIKSKGFLYTELDMSILAVSLFHKDPLVRFAVYVYLLEADLTTSFNAGMRYIPTDIQECHVLGHMAPGDLIDNDCDGKFDEERWNEKDTDGDGKIDEDVVAETQDGTWGNWMPWFCNAQCGARGARQRLRACDDPPPSRGGIDCFGNKKEIGDACTGFGKVCPPECPPGKFSHTCEADCPKGCAFRKCQRENGTCFGCVLGYRPSLFCQYKGKNFDALMESERGFLSKLVSFDLGWQYYLFIPIGLTLILAVAAYFIGKRWKKKSLEKELQDEKEAQAEQEAFEEAMGDD